MPDQPHIDLVFDGPPTHHGSRLLDCEDNAGHSVKAGSWVDRGDGTWTLRITADDIPGAADRMTEQEKSAWAQFHAEHPNCSSNQRWTGGKLPITQIDCTSPENHRDA